MKVPPSQPKRAFVISRRTEVWLFIIALFGYVGISFVVAYIISVPPRQPIEGDPQQNEGLDYEEIIFPARHDQVAISAWFIPNATSKRAIILVHGKGQNRTREFGQRNLEFAAMLHKQGFNILMLDMRGHGKSGKSRFTYGIRERRDVLGAVDWLQEQGFIAGSIGVLGVSMGAASSIGATAEDEAIGALVSDSAFAEFYPIVQRAFTKESGLPNFFLPSTMGSIRLLVGENILHSRPVDDIRKIAPRPVLLIHASGDSLIPVAHAYQLQAAMPSAELWVIEGSTHAKTFNVDEQTYSKRVGGFFDQHLKE